ncbi:MAG: hypothetical protein IKB28_02285 [Clostridia bacterium]|nr:hypothetical protein [Clostridia bacterium]
MKKNTMMRVASVLLVAVLLSTCVISSTFAKYVTSVNGSDSARVAKWGIGSDLSGTQTFSTSYDNGMIASGENPKDDVVAPGASDEGVYILTGTPETAYQVTFNFDKTNDVFLNKGTYTCSDGATNNYVVNDDPAYNPIQWTVTLSTSNGSIVDGGLQAGENEYDDLDQVAAAIDATKIDFAANQTCDVEITIAWDWAFSSANNVNDAADTVLGNLAADASKVKGTNNADLTANTDYCLNVGYTLVLTATQVNTPAQP